MNGLFRQSMTWLHTWSGIVVCWLLYFMFVTGTIGYFDDELDLWMTPEQPASQPLALSDAVPVAQQHLASAAPGADRWFLYPTIKRTNPQLSTFYDVPESEGTPAIRQSDDLDPRTGAVMVPPRDTGGGQLLYRMHYLLHYLPGRLGYYIMAVATMFMFVGLMTGVVAHKKIFKDFFTFRWARGRRSWLDLHNLASVATLPFQFMITYSGLIFTLGLFWMPFIALGGYGFDTQKLAQVPAAFAGVEAPTRAGTSAELADLLPMAEAAQAQWGPNQIAFIRVDYPGDANAQVTLQRESTDRLGGSAWVFDGVSGERLHTSEGIDNAAIAVAGTFLALHEGLFADTVLRWIYFLSGVLGTIMIGTGAVYWVEKRRPASAAEATSRGYGLVARANVATIAGLLVAVAAFLWANRLLPLDLASRAEWEVHCMFLCWLALFVHASLRPVARAWYEQTLLVAGAFLALPVVNALTTSAHLGTTLPAGNWVLAGVDLTCIALGLCAVVAARALRPPALAAAPSASSAPGSVPQAGG
ncbi:MAG: PepSY-associated TM helix domain-containing protein [Pseudomonadota bacterium]